MGKNRVNGSTLSISVKKGAMLKLIQRKYAEEKALEEEEAMIKRAIEESEREAKLLQAAAP